MFIIIVFKTKVEKLKYLLIKHNKPIYKLYTI